MDQDIKWKAFLYAVPLFLTPFADKIVAILFQDQWPSLPKIVGCAVLGTIATSLGLRMFYDGSYERSKNGNGNGNGSLPPTPKI